MKTTITSLFSACLLSFVSSQVYAQSTLAVNCYDSDTPFNSISINDEVVEYGVYGLEPGFYVSVIDQTTCTPWGTNYNGANPNHSFGNYNETNGRPRVENFFFFQYQDSLQLAGMVNMLNQIPAGHAVVVYTPISYDFNEVNAVNANATQALSARWNPVVIEGNEIMILFGIQGNQSSFTEETTLLNGQLSFNTTICSSLSIDEAHENTTLFVGKSGTSYVLNPILNATEVQVVDAAGRIISTEFSNNELTFPSETTNGIYIIRVNSNGKWIHSKQALVF